jgi:uncharacterized protein (DUF2267 family)
MRYEEFLTQVEERAGIERDQAERAVAATLTTLARRLTAEEAQNLAAQLPSELKVPLVGTTAAAESFGADEFLLRVSEAAEMDEDEARRSAGVVLAALRDTVTKEEMRDVLAQLSRDYDALFR